MAYIKIDETNRITAASHNYHCGNGEVEVIIPNEMDITEIHDYLYVDGKFVHDPLPKPGSIEKEPTTDEVLNVLLGIGGEA